MSTRDPFEKVSGSLGLFGTAAAVLAIAFAPAIRPAEVTPPVEEPPVVMLLAEEAPPEAPPPPPQPVPPPPPAPAPPPKQAPPRPLPPPAPLPTPAVEPPPPPAPVQPEAPPPAPEPPPPAPPPPPAQAPVPAVPQVNTAAIQAGYVERLRGYIRSITEYPTSGDARRLRPEGATIVRFSLTRSGVVRNVEVERGSGSPILDKQALSIVRGGRYPAWPADAWSGSDEHTFTVTVQFVSP